MEVTDIENRGTNSLPTANKGQHTKCAGCVVGGGSGTRAGAGSRVGGGGGGGINATRSVARCAGGGCAGGARARTGAGNRGGGYPIA